MLTFDTLKFYEHELVDLCRSFFHPFSERFECVVLESSYTKPNTVHISLGIGCKDILVIHTYSIECATSIFQIQYGHKDSQFYSLPVLEWLHYVQEKGSAPLRAIQFMNAIKEELIAKVWHPSRVERLIELRGLDILID
jgi:hypothetical protein